MGTNYYYHMKPACECCGRPYEPLHIGKSSAGWCFSLHVIPKEGINCLQDWYDLWVVPNSRIEDEYHREVTAEEMLSVVTHRYWGDSKPYSDKFYRDNNAEVGPNGLLRHIIDGRFCIGHGEGTWSYLIGEFS